MFTCGVFISIFKANDIVDVDILICKLINYEIGGNNLKTFESYLNNRNQFISFDKKNTYFANIKCGFPQRSILGPLLYNFKNT